MDILIRSSDEFQELNGKRYRVWYGVNADGKDRPVWALVALVMFPVEDLESKEEAERDLVVLGVGNGTKPIQIEDGPWEQKAPG